MALLVLKVQLATKVLKDRKARKELVDQKALRESQAKKARQEETALLGQKVNLDEMVLEESQGSSARRFKDLLERKVPKVLLANKDLLVMRARKAYLESPAKTAVKVQWVQKALAARPETSVSTAKWRLMELKGLMVPTENQAPMVKTDSTESAESREPTEPSARKEKKEPRAQLESKVFQEFPVSKEFQAL